MLLAIDVGNSTIVVGLFQDDRLTHRFQMASNRRATADEYGVFVLQALERKDTRVAQLDAVLISSVVPPLDAVMTEVSERYLGKRAYFVGRDLGVNLAIQVDTPGEVGADRLVNALAAWRRYQTALIVVDFGTATTLDVVSAEGAYLGGAIAPGIGIAGDALFHAASKLPRVELAIPARVIGKNTREAIQSGLFLGYIGLIDTLVDRMRAEMGVGLKVIATGGLAKLFMGQSRTIEEVDPDLTLEGLSLIYRENWRLCESDHR